MRAELADGGAVSHVLSCSRSAPPGGSSCRLRLREPGAARRAAAAAARAPRRRMMRVRGWMESSVRAQPNDDCGCACLCLCLSGS